MQVIYSRGLVDKTTSENFIEFAVIGGEKQKAEFTREVTWILESSTEFLYLHGRKVIKSGAGYNDYYGYLTSIRGLEDAAGFAKEFEITQESSLILIAKTTITSRAVLLTEDNKAENLNKPYMKDTAYTAIPPTWLQLTGMEDDIPQYASGTDFNRILLSKEIWSSKNSIEENAQLMDEFRKSWIEK